MVEETQFSIYNLRLLLSVSQCCHVQKGWPRVLTARALPSKTWICLQIDKRLARLVEHVRFASAQAEVLKIPRFGSPKLIAFRKSVRSAAGDIGYSPNVVLRIFWARIWICFWIIMKLCWLGSILGKGIGDFASHMGSILESCKGWRKRIRAWERGCGDLEWFLWLVNLPSPYSP